MASVLHTRQLTLIEDWLRASTQPQPSVRASTTATKTPHGQHCAYMDHSPGASGSPGEMQWIGLKSSRRFPATFRITVAYWRHLLSFELPFHSRIAQSTHILSTGVRPNNFIPLLSTILALSYNAISATFFSSLPA